VSDTVWFWYAVVCALLSLVGLSVAVGLGDRWIAVVATVAFFAFTSAAVLFGRVLFGV
jgi:hypothetical protein